MLDNEVPELNRNVLLQEHRAVGEELCEQAFVLRNLSDNLINKGRYDSEESSHG